MKNRQVATLFLYNDSMDGREVLDYYRTRLLEFCFRDGKLAGIFRDTSKIRMNLIIMKSFYTIYMLDDSSFEGCKLLTNF